jgi:hypothetical protein
MIRWISLDFHVHYLSIDEHSGLMPTALIAKIGLISHVRRNFMKSFLIHISMAWRDEVEDILMV